MKKIRTCILLTVLCSSLGVQTSTVLASELDRNSGGSTTEASTEDTGQSTTEKPTEDTGQSTAEKPTEDTGQSTVEKPAEDTGQSTVEKPAEDTGQSTTEKPTEDTGQSTTEKPTEDTSQSTTEKPTEDTGQSTTEKPTEDTSQSTTKKQEADNDLRITPNKSTSEQTNESVDSSTSSAQSDSSVRYHVNKTTQEFINQVGEKARKIGLKNDLYASVMIAQAILESGSGSSALSDIPNYNLFGIKGDFKGETVTFATSEDDGSGSLYTIQANFRKYPSYKESLEDYAQLMNEGISGDHYFYKGVHKTYAKTYKDATRFLTGKYATDIHYNEKLKGLIETYQLESFDKETLKSEPMIINDKEVSSFTIENPINHQSSSFIIPLYKGYVISSPFEQRINPVTGAEEHHNGIDLAVDGGTPIYASNQGKVIQSSYESGAGNYVLVQHENGIITNYYHMSQIAVQTNQAVQMGDVLGYVGSTGNSTGNHLHFGISTGVWSGYLNPSDYFNF